MHYLFLTLLSVRLSLSALSLCLSLLTDAALPLSLLSLSLTAVLSLALSSALSFPPCRGGACRHLSYYIKQNVSSTLLGVMVTCSRLPNNSVPGRLNVSQCDLSIFR